MSWVLVAAVVAGSAGLVGYAVRAFNRMVVLRNRTREGWANVDTELRRRHDLIPNLVAAVKGSARHERDVLTRLVRLRTQASRTQADPHTVSKLERQVSAGIDRLLFVAEAYPSVTASRNFLALQEELAITEDRIQAARRFYNASVRDYHDEILTFPANLFAALYGFRPTQFFQVDQVHLRNAPRVRVSA